MNTLLFTLKFFADTSYYMVYAAFLGGVLGAGTLTAQTALLCAAALLCRALGEKKAALRLLPLLLLPLLFFLPGGWRAGLLALPPALYLGYTVCRRLFEVDRSAAIDHFLGMLRILPVPFLFVLLLGNRTLLQRCSFPYVLAYLFAYILLLRLLRHDEEVRRQRRFRVLNALELCGALLAALALFSQQFRWLLARLGGLIYRYVIGPILMLVSYVFVGIGWLVTGLLSKLLGRLLKQKPPEQETLATEDLAKTLQERYGGAENAELWSRILIALGIVLACVLVFLLFKRLLGKRRRESAAAGLETRELLDTPRGARPPRRFGARTPAEQVRYWYRKYLLLARARGAELTPYQTTYQQRGEAGRYLAGEGQDALRALYLPARYGAEPGRDAPAEAKRLYESLKK